MKIKNHHIRNRAALIILQNYKLRQRLPRLRALADSLRPNYHVYSDQGYCVYCPNTHRTDLHKRSEICEYRVKYSR